MPNPTITASSYAGEFAGKYIAASLLTAKTLDDAYNGQSSLSFSIQGKNATAVTIAANVTLSNIAKNTNFRSLTSFFDPTTFAINPAIA